MKSIVTALCLVPLACAHADPVLSNAQFRESYDRGTYDDIVAVEGTRYRGVDESISARALEAIEAEIVQAGGHVVTRCAEDEMERLDTSWLAGSFSFEIHVEGGGDVSDVKLVEHDVRTRRGEPRYATEFGPCVEGELSMLSLDAQPGRAYVHTYMGFVGEAW